VFDIDWKTLLTPSIPLAETIVRGSAVYLSLFALLRVFLKRVTGTVGIADLLMIVLIADAAQNAMANDYTSITDGLILVATIIFWNYTLDWLGYRVPLLQRFVHPPPLQLIKDGRMLLHNMRRELITRDELMSQLREQGVDDLATVQEAHMEGDGRISVITRDGHGNGDRERREI
jgi:uncharacterized membrane protein YcaP (DUF421 family)